MPFRRGQRVRVPDPAGVEDSIEARFIGRARTADGTASGAYSDMAWVEYLQGPNEGWTGRHPLDDLEEVPAPTGAVIAFQDHFPPVYPTATHAPLYDKIEFCRDPETLWRKVESRWDWLGIKPDGQFVLGYPRRKPHLEAPHGAYGAIRAPGVTEGRHVVRVRRPNVAEWSIYWLGSEAAAKAKFGRIVVAQSGKTPTARPTLLRVQRLEQNEVIEDELVLSRVATYG
jgi:hypothetical protein